MDSGKRWTFLSNHALVLAFIAANPGAPLRRAADAVGITERAVQRIVAELESAAYLTRSKQGRSNRYAINEDRPLGHALEAPCTVGELLELVGGRPDAHRSDGPRGPRRTFDSWSVGAHGSEVQ
jgi:hypothetical protein